MLTIGALYQLDGTKYRLCSVKEWSGLCWFQELNPDGSDYIEYYKNSEGANTVIKDWGRRIIYNRINEIKQI